MMPLFIPFSPAISGDQFFHVDLGGAVVSLRLFWNVRDRAWYMDVVARNSRILGLKLSPRNPLIRGRRDLGVAGDFYVLKTRQEATLPISFDALGNSWGLYWLSPGEFNGI